MDSTLSPHALATRTLTIFLQLLLRKSQQRLSLSPSRICIGLTPRQKPG